MYPHPPEWQEVQLGKKPRDNKYIFALFMFINWILSGYICIHFLLYYTGGALS